MCYIYMTVTTALPVPVAFLEGSRHWHNPEQIGMTLSNMYISEKISVCTAGFKRMTQVGYVIAGELKSK